MIVQKMRYDDAEAMGRHFDAWNGFSHVDRSLGL
jgi:hypothetical protein